MRRLIGRKKWVVFVGFLLVLSVIVAACSTISSWQSPEVPLVYADGEEREKSDLWPEKSLKQAFMAYWAYRFSGEIEKGYQIEAPYVREMIAPDRYALYLKNSGVNQLLKIEILDVVKVTDHLYVVHGNNHILQPGDKKIESYFEDEWVEYGGQWYHVLRDQFLLPRLSMNMFGRFFVG